ncbi:MAG: hypothetical protein JOY51_09625 [Nevskia sp.]|nr:hypothetical protein [Nevskia sp.]
MKPNRIALTFSLSAALFCGAALAQDTPAEAVAAPTAPAKHHHHHGAQKAIKSVRYDDCVKEKSAVAETFCSAHGSSCEAEKDGVAKQCRSEARGERQKG